MKIQSMREWSLKTGQKIDAGSMVYIDNEGWLKETSFQKMYNENPFLEFFFTGETKSGKIIIYS